VPAYEAERAALLKNFGATLRELREARFPSQEALAEAATLNRVHVGYLEQGRREPSLTTPLILAEALDVSVERLAQGLVAPKARRPAPHRGRRRP
jgi:XRE family transcriptional regulator, regulator of sulfur utilization